MGKSRTDAQLCVSTAVRLYSCASLAAPFLWCPFGCRSAAATPRFVSASYAKTAGFPPTPSRAAIVASDILEKTELDKINQYKLYRVNERCKKT